MKKCVIVPDSFKGTLSAIQICQIAKNKILEFFPNCDVITIPVADGGEGTVDCFLTALNATRITTTVSGPYFEKIQASYCMFEDTAIIEMASCSGLPLVGNNTNPSLTTTYGVGELIKHAFSHGAKKVYLGLGGSCTNDGGCGCAAALGVKFTDELGNEFIPVGATLDKIHHIDKTEFINKYGSYNIFAMCDVTNPLHGLSGAAHIFARQKGADDDMISLLDQNLSHLAYVIEHVLCINNISDLPGGGAAGGLGAGVVAFLNATLHSGIETVLDIVNFDNIIKDCDAIFTGEGRIDFQSVQGKVISGVSKHAKLQSVPVYAIVGDISDDAYQMYDVGVTAMFSINRLAIPFSEAKTRSREDFTHTFEDILRLIRSIKYNRV